LASPPLGPNGAPTAASACPLSSSGGPAHTFALDAAAHCVAPVSLPISAATVLALEDLVAQSSAGVTAKALGALRVRSSDPVRRGVVGVLDDILVRMALARKDTLSSPLSKVTPAWIHRSASLLRVLNLPDDDSRSGWDTVLPSARSAWLRLLSLDAPASLASDARPSGLATPSASKRLGGGGGAGHRRPTISSRNGPGRGTHLFPLLTAGLCYAPVARALILLPRLISGLGRRKFPQRQGRSRCQPTPTSTSWRHLYSPP